jgi:adenosylcobinamide kinase/adenosylcobinamide-phosphate guanylyltransferase
MTRTLILGGARSGKSAHAERLALASGKEVIVIVTAHAGDSEMATRIAHHRARRPAHWITVEEGIALGDALHVWRTPERIVLIDCLTLWLSNLLFSCNANFPEIGPVTLPPLMCEQQAAFRQALAQPGGDVLIVSNELGMGIVPQGAASRAFADEAGRMNQAAAALCEQVILVAAGLPLLLKGAPCSPA